MDDSRTNPRGRVYNGKVFWASSLPTCRDEFFPRSDVDEKELVQRLYSLLRRRQSLLADGLRLKLESVRDFVRQCTGVTDGLSKDCNNAELAEMRRPRFELLSRVVQLKSVVDSIRELPVIALPSVQEGLLPSLQGISDLRRRTQDEEAASSTHGTEIAADVAFTSSGVPGTRVGAHAGTTPPIQSLEEPATNRAPSRDYHENYSTKASELGGMQRRTYFASRPIDIFRFPVAPWKDSVLFNSQTSEHFNEVPQKSLWDENVGCAKSVQYVSGYNSFRVDASPSWESHDSQLRDSVGKAWIVGFQRETHYAFRKIPRYAKFSLG